MSALGRPRGTSASSHRIIANCFCRLNAQNSHGVGECGERHLLMKATILCIDDEAVGLAIRAQVLRSAGYTVFEALSGEEALHILADQRIEIVISDYLLGGCTGTQVAVSMKKMRPEIPVIILSGVIELPEDMESADLFLSKLEPPAVLLATVADLLARRNTVMRAAAATCKAG